MLDIHCHILPCVDDGARDLDESLAMLDAARRFGVTAAVCTPHCRDPYFDYDAMWDAFEMLVDASGGFDLRMGFEVNARKLDALGMAWVGHLCIDGTADILLELPDSATAVDMPRWERMIFDLQGMGRRVIIAHPERVRAVRDDVGVARRLRSGGCLLQASADFIAGGRPGSSGASAARLVAEGLYDCVASDAHRPEHYRHLSQVLERYPLLGVDVL